MLHGPTQGFGVRLLTRGSFLMVHGTMADDLRSRLRAGLSGGFAVNLSILQELT
ncbi:unnamed protein product [Protopolystoma xenopodis]|uniref:Uncharacterized protein n=1 Tax=Protopolystoma xenopodis TaxID=117903 RepID=A0A3S5A9E8_9PLAT|nr:unnamed protein product [Protopolystoma xenopodis]